MFTAHDYESLKFYNKSQSLVGRMRLFYPIQPTKNENYAETTTFHTIWYFAANYVYIVTRLLVAAIAISIKICTNKRIESLLHLPGTIWPIQSKEILYSY